MQGRLGWSREQLLIAFKLYCEIPFGKMHYRNPEVVKYAELIGRTPSALAMKLTNIASLDPAITSTGRRGLSAASASDRAMWEEMQSDWESFIIEIQKAENQLCRIDKSIETDINESFLIDKVIDYSGKNKVVQTTIRVGQSFFRRSVLSAYNSRCCITGLSIPELLVASHIVPWSVDTKNRMNPKNGLCLSMLHDKAFDLGVITISEDMSVIISKKYVATRNDFFRQTLLAYDDMPIRLPEKFRPDPNFLSFHRLNIFKE